MDKEYLLVDGYNIIFAWDKLKKIADNSLEDARDKLLAIMSNYRGVKKAEVIVVFDAHKVKGGTGSYIKQGNIYVVYTKEAETADTYIERTTNILAKDYKVSVATSDGLEQIIIMGRGAIRISASELETEVMDINKSIRKNYIENRPVKNNLLMDNLDSDTIKWMERARRGQ